MARTPPREDRPAREEAESTPLATNGSPAQPIEGRLAVWTPRAAAVGCMGLTYWLGCRGEGGLRGVHALLFPFFGGDVAGRAQAAYLLSNLTSPVLVWTAEASRGGTSAAKLAAQSLVGLAVQLRGIERVAPIYYLLSMAALDPGSSEEGEIVHTMPPEVAGAVLPATILGYVIPAALISLVPLTATGVSRSYFNLQALVVYAFSSAPVSVPVLTTLISRLGNHIHGRADLGRRQVDKATPEAGRPSRRRNGLDVLRSLGLAYAVSFAIQAAQHMYTVTRNVTRMPGGQRSLGAAVASLLADSTVPGRRHSSIALYAGATLGFGLYTVWDLRRRGMVTNTDAAGSAVAVLAGQVLFGPGATYAGLWWWREGVLARNALSGSSR